MAVKTYTENYNADYKASWKVTVVGTDVTASGETFTVNAPAISATYTYAGKTLGGAQVSALAILIQGNDTEYSTFGPYIYPSNWTGSLQDLATWASGASKSLVLHSNAPTSKSVITRKFFHSGTENMPALQISLGSRSFNLFSAKSKSGTVATIQANRYVYSISTDVYQWFSNICSVTLNAPPTIETPTVSKNTDAWATGLTTASVSIPITYVETTESSTQTQATAGTAKYGGYVKQIIVNFNGSSVTQNYTSSTKPTTTQTISVPIQNSGTFKPTVTVRDSRGQSTTVELDEITVFQYNVPTFDFSVFRCNSNGLRADEGAFGLITSTLNYTSEVAHLTEPVVQVNGTTTNNVTWYKSLLSTGAVDTSTEIDGTNITWSSVSDGSTVYGLINGSFATTQSYSIGMSETDSVGGVSTTLTQTLSTAFYTIDFKAGGKEIAFGAPAKETLTQHQEDVGLFKCEMETRFTDNVFINSLIGTMQMYAGSSAPTGWLFCDGSAVSRTTYSALYNVIGTTYGTGDGSTTFNLPDLRGRVPIGVNNSALPNGADSTWSTRNRNDKGGAETVGLVDADIAHGHGFTQPVYTVTGGWTDDAITGGSHTHQYGYLTQNRGTGSTGTRVGPYGHNSSGVTKIGSSSETHTHDLPSHTHTVTRTTNGAVTNLGTPSSRTNHNNMQPYISVNYIIFVGV